ncbi:MAG: hypothetical protein P1U57_02995 [Oleibacter sp.]|nr:hypothetical protein [Thalassolituus sp.]
MQSVVTNVVSTILLASSLMLLVACGPSSYELQEQQRLAERQAQAELAAEREQTLRQQRRSQRLNDAKAAWSSKRYPDENQWLSMLGTSQGMNTDEIIYAEFMLQPLDYNYREGKQSFVIVDLRAILSSSNIPLLEFSVHKETFLDDMQNVIELPTGKRIAVVTDNFKRKKSLLTEQKTWRWEYGTIEDISWFQDPTRTISHANNREMTLQLGFRLCRLVTCQKQYQYEQHSINGFSADVVSALISDRSKQQILAEFVSDRS